MTHEYAAYSAEYRRDHGISITIGPDGWWLPTDPNQPDINTVARGMTAAGGACAQLLHNDRARWPS